MYSPRPGEAFYRFTFAGGWAGASVKGFRPGKKRGDIGFLFLNFPVSALKLIVVLGKALLTFPVLSLRAVGCSLGWRHVAGIGYIQEN